MGVTEGVGGVWSVLGAGRDCRYSGTRRSIGASRGIGAPRGCRGIFRCIRGCQGCIGGSQGLSVFRGQKGYMGIRDS